MEENKKESWKSVEEYLASEIINGASRESRAKNIGIICVSLLSAAIIGGLLIVNHLNTKSFLNYLSEYDFVSQDGEGFNYYNSDIGGNVNYGPESKETEKPEESTWNSSEEKEETEIRRIK